MKTLTVDLPDRIAEHLDELVRAGWFPSQEEAVRLALLDFLQTRQLQLAERFQLDDIAWAVSQRDESA